MTKDCIAGRADFLRAVMLCDTDQSEHCSWLQQSRCHAVINNWTVPFAAYTAAETPMLFNGLDDHLKLPLPWRISIPSNTWFLGPLEWASKRHLYWFSRFCTADLCDQQRQTHRQTEGKVRFLYSTAYAMAKPAHFTISKMAVNWQEPMVLQHKLQPSNCMR